MKITLFHLFIIMILALLICPLISCPSVEGMDNNTDSNDNANDTEQNANDTEQNANDANDANDVNNYNSTNNTHSNTYNTTIKKSDIIPGTEDLYILKSEIVPPVCPMCPVSAACPRQTPCQPCPPCGRCPEPAFDCKKVPNYSGTNTNYLPKPVMSDFSQFSI
jgi:hypothetical protein